MMRRILLLLLLPCLLASQTVHAVLTIEITQGGDAGLPIAIAPFVWQGQGKLPQDIAAIVSSDLARSGRIAPIPQKQFIASPKDSDINFKDWRLIKAEALLTGRVSEPAPGQYHVEFRLYDVFKEQQLAGYLYRVNTKLLRTAAHQISDVVYEKLTGEPGVFNTRIAYITKQTTPQRSVYKLQVADADGYGPVTIVTSPEPLMSPAWSPDGKRLAYVSFEKKRSMVYLQNLSDGRREKLAEFRGINSAPAWSPDGRRLAMTLSRAGNPEIYVMNLATRAVTRLTRNYAIDTEPSWSPDGKKMVFTSDRAGRPHIYRMNADGSDVERLTFEGSYNARASYSQDGKSLTLVMGEGGKFHIAILHLANNATHILTETPLDESPSFSPNGRIVLYATELRDRGVLASVSADGRVRQLYTFDQGDVREPAWSPVTRQLR